MKKLLQLSLVALAGQLAFSCSPTKEYYQFAAKDSAYGFVAPKKEVQPETAAPATEANEVQEEALVQEPVMEASAGTDLATAAAYTAPVYAAPVAVTKAIKTKPALAAAAADVSAPASKADSETKAAVTKKDTKKKIKDVTKTERLSGNLRLALLLAIVGIVAAALTGVTGLGVLMGIISGVAFLGAGIFFVLWLLDEL